MRVEPPRSDVEPPPPGGLRAVAWSNFEAVEHRFFCRHGGVSAAALGTLNLSDRVGDAAENVAENWRRVRSAIGGLPIARMRQTHGTHLARVTNPDQPIGEADAMLTQRSGVALAVLTADCVPLLAVAPEVPAVMAIHAGWRGSLAGIAALALADAQTALGIDASAWHVALGPSIAGCCYEVERRIGDAFVARWGAMPDAWQPGSSRGQLDLRQVNRRILIEQGVPDRQIDLVGPCTACASADYFSHRRSGGQAGRQASLIALRPASR